MRIHVVGHRCLHHPHLRALHQSLPLSHSLRHRLGLHFRCCSSYSPPCDWKQVHGISICDKKTLCCIDRLCLESQERLGMYTAPYEQLAPNNSLTLHRPISLQEPVVSG